MTEISKGYVERSIVVADSFTALDELAERVCLNATPGFQADPEFVKRVGMDHVMDALAATTLKVLGEETPLVDFAFGQGVIDGYAHLDGGFMGLAVHINRALAQVRLAHLYDDTPEQRAAFTAAQYNLFERRPVGLRHMLVGTAAVGAVTIFSEGNIGDLKASVHQFMRLQPGLPFVRFTTNRNRRRSIPMSIEQARAKAQHYFDVANTPIRPLVPRIMKKSPEA